MKTQTRKAAGASTAEVASLDGMRAQIDHFNEAVTATPVPSRPTILNKDRLKWAMAALQEELQEFKDACDQGDVVEAADALIDMAYFALGRLSEMGVPANAVFESVQRANMAKQRGQLSKRPGSKGHDAIKPEGWQPPDHSWLLNFQLSDLRDAAAYKALSPVLKKVAELRARKSQDYNSGPQLRDYFPFGHVSYAQMLHVKNLRIQSLLARMEAGHEPNFEGILDSVEDLINYSTFYGEAILAGDVPSGYKKVA